MKEEWRLKITGARIVQSSLSIALRRIKLEKSAEDGWFRVDGYRYERTGNPMSGRYFVTKLTEVPSDTQVKIQEEAKALIPEILALPPDDERYAKTLVNNAIYQWQGYLNLEPQPPAESEQDELAYWAAALKAAVRQMQQASRPVLEEA